jgi:protein-tyrosine phosphatase
MPRGPMIDLHTHVLPGLDDGARDLDAALAICRAAAADGVAVLAATPHVRADYPTRAEAMQRGVAVLAAAAAGIVEVRPGGELALEMLDRASSELRPFGLGGNPRYLLVETPYHGWPLDLDERMFRLRVAGFTPVLAHPERNADVQAHPQLLDAHVANGGLVQLTAGSVDGRLGERSRACAEALLARQAAHLLASDAHEPHVRAAGLSAAAAALHDDELARWLTTDVPRALVDDLELPPRPARAGRRVRARAFSRRRGARRAEPDHPS